MERIPASSTKIEYTYDYDKFKLVGINRNVDKRHVVSIANAIQLRNLLHLFPLIVNKDFEVLDGQHRLAAVKLCAQWRASEMPIYYIMDSEIQLDDMRLLNSNKINWKNQDYINYYAASGVPEFVKLYEFQKANPKINLSACMTLLSTKGRNLRDIKNGSICVDTVALANETMRYIYELSKRMSVYTPFTLRFGKRATSSPP